MACGEYYGWIRHWKYGARDSKYVTKIGASVAYSQHEEGGERMKSTDQKPVWSGPVG